MSENVVIKKDRTVTVPASEAKIGVQYDHNVNAITFDCPRYPDDDRNVDMSTMQIYINYMLPDKTLGSYLAENVKVDTNNPDTIHFDWKITRNVTQVKGALQALVCIKKVDAEGNELYHWNTDLIQSFRVGEGMECLETISSDYSDVISQLLVNMNTVTGEFEALSADVTARTSEETLQGLVNNAASDEKLGSIVNAYMEANPVGINVDDTLTVSGDAADAKITGDRISELKSDLAEIKDDVKPINLYNKNSDLNHNDVKVQASGNFIALSGSSVSHPIKIELGKTYCFKFSNSFYGTNANRCFRFCNADGTLITTDGYFFNATVSSDGNYGYFTVNDRILAMGEYVCVNVRTSDKSVMIFAEGDTLPEYSDYFEPYAEIKESVLPKFVKMVNGVSPDDNGNVNTNTDGIFIHNPLYEKKLAVNGDSICYGAGDVGGYAKYIGQRNNMTVANNAQSGGTLAYVSGRHCISRTIANMPNDADYYIIEGGVNDASGLAELGTITSSYIDTLDDTTTLGALESICKQLQTTFVGKKYGFIFVHNCFGWSDNWNTTRKSKMKEVLNKWGIPYLDLGDSVPQLRNVDALRTYTSNSDGWHPTAEGYQTFYVPKIEAWLRTL